MSQAEDIVYGPNKPERKVVEKCREVAEFTGSYAYQFVGCKDGSFYEVRVPSPGSPAVTTVVDPQGRPLGEPRPVEPPQPMIATANGLAPAPTPEPEPKAGFFKRLFKKTS